jgi:hypothetical protein
VRDELVGPFDCTLLVHLVVFCAEPIVRLDTACVDDGADVEEHRLQDRLDDPHVAPHLTLDDDLASVAEVGVVFPHKVANVLHVLCR